MHRTIQSREIHRQTVGVDEGEVWELRVNDCCFEGRGGGMYKCSKSRQWGSVHNMSALKPTNLKFASNG